MDRAELQRAHNDFLAKSASFKEKAKEFADALFVLKYSQSSFPLAESFLLEKVEHYTQLSKAYRFSASELLEEAQFLGQCP